MVYKHKIDNDEFEGHIEIDVPKYTQRLKYLQECKFKTDDSGNIKVDMNSLDSIIRMIEFCEKHISKVDIKNKITGVEYKSMDELQSDNSCDALVNEIGGIVLNGVKLGKN